MFDTRAGFLPCVSHVTLHDVRHNRQLSVSIQYAAGPVAGPAIGGNEVPNSSRRAPALKYLAMLFALVLLVAACGGGSDKKSSSGGGGGSGGGSEGTPVEGGKITYGLEAKTTTFCLPVAQLAIAGILVVESVYDTLMRPTQDNPNTYVPYLAKSVDHNADYTQWTIVNRSGVTFQDGTPLTADIVKQNIDAWRSGVLLGFVFQNIASTAVTAPDTVVVTMKTPWVAFPAYLWSTGRTGIAAPAQLDDQNTCDTNMIGTGPFKLKSFDPNTGDVSVTKNPTYWRKDSAGRQLPYLDEIDFKPQEESGQRVNGLQGGQFDIIHGQQRPRPRQGPGDGQRLHGRHRAAGADGDRSRPAERERPPFDKLVSARRSLRAPTTRSTRSPTRATSGSRTSVFDTQVMGYVKDPGLPEVQPGRRQEPRRPVQAAERRQVRVPAAVDVRSADPGDRRRGAAPDAPDRRHRGPAATGRPGDDHQQGRRQRRRLLPVAQLPRPDPDTMYVWFHSGSTVNFNHINDPTIDQALETGRTSSDARDPQEGLRDLQQADVESGVQHLELVHHLVPRHPLERDGYLGPNLPDADGKPGNQKPADLLAGYHQMLGIWVDK